MPDKKLKSKQGAASPLIKRVFKPPEESNLDIEEDLDGYRYTLPSFNTDDKLQPHSRKQTECMRESKLSLNKLTTESLANQDSSRDTLNPKKPEFDKFKIKSFMVHKIPITVDSRLGPESHNHKRMRNTFYNNFRTRQPGSREKWANLVHNAKSNQSLSNKRLNLSKFTNTTTQDLSPQQITMESGACSAMSKTKTHHFVVD
mmetsp:Transcript_10843/g.16468  ORF Transcript_10843/g.16468 Transcript_10843/m.16468 type:complete len:202 (-) Transcript_10843:228-833(-)